MKPIPQEWLLEYAEKMLAEAKTWPNSSMKEALWLRAEIIKSVVLKFQEENGEGK